MRLLVWVNWSEFDNNRLLFTEHLEFIMNEYDHPVTLLTLCDKKTQEKLGNIINEKQVSYIHLGPHATSITDISLALAISQTEEVFIEKDLFSLEDSDFLKSATQILQLIRPALIELKSNIKQGQLKNVTEKIDSFKAWQQTDDGTLSIYLRKYLRHLKRFSSWHSACFIDDRQALEDKDIFEFDENCFDSNNGIDIVLPSLTEAIKNNNDFYRGGIEVYKEFRQYKKKYSYGKLLAWGAVVFRKKALLYKNRNQYLLATSFLVRFLEEYVKAFLLLNALCELEGDRILVDGKGVNGVGPYLKFLEQDNSIKFEEKSLIFRSAFKALGHRNKSILGHGYTDLGKNSFDIVYGGINSFIQEMEQITDHKWYTKFNKANLVLYGLNIEKDLKAMFDHNYGSNIHDIKVGT